MPGSGAACFPVLMMNRIMTPRVAALALAATPLIALPALADGPGQSARDGLSLNLGETSLYVSAGHDRWRGRHARYNEWGQSRREVRRLRRDAVHRCAGAIRHQGYRIGFRDVDIDDDYRVRQTAPRNFRVRFEDVEFEGRRREFDRDVRCIVRHGHVVDLDGLPHRGYRGRGHGRDHHRRDRHHDYDRDRRDHHDWRDRDRRRGH